MWLVYWNGGCFGWFILDQDNVGNRVSGSFNTHVMDCIITDSKVKFPNNPLTKKLVHNRMKSIKKKKKENNGQNGTMLFTQI